MRIPGVLRQFLCKLRRHATATVEDHLNDIDKRIAELANGIAEIAENERALLQASIHLVEAHAQHRANQDEGLGTLGDSVVEQSWQIRRALDESLTALGESLVEQITAQPARILQTQDALLERVLQIHDAWRDTAAAFDSVESLLPQLRDHLASEPGPRVTVETSDYVSTNPELGLMSFLYSHLPSHVAIDIGAHTGEVSEYLLRAGYDVFAFEPYPPTYKRLIERLKDWPGFKAFAVALGSESGEGQMHLVTADPDAETFEDPTVFHSLTPHGMPEGLTFTSTVPVPVRRLADLHRDGSLPPADDIGLVKVDTEGYDFDVVRGMDEFRYPVVVVEFWDDRIPFASEGVRYDVPRIVAGMHRRGYRWYIVMYRVWGKDVVAFFCNHDRPVPNSWGNIFFFRDRDTFMQAQAWCLAVLPRTFFKPVPSSHSSVQSLTSGQDLVCSEMTNGIEAGDECEHNNIST